MGRLLALATFGLVVALVSTERAALVIAVLSMVISLYAVWLVRRSGAATLEAVERQTEVVQEVKTIATDTEARLRGDDD